MLAAISETLQKAGLSIENVTTHVQRRGGHGDKIYFIVEGECVTTSYMNMDEIHEMTAKLSELKQQLNLEVCDIRVQRLKQTSGE